jgi:hypothetical protein
MKTLMFTPTGVCFNCLNGGHDICQYLGCKCSGRDHRQWWFRDDGITNEQAALRRDDMSQYMEPQVRALAMHCVALHHVVTMFDRQEITWEQAMTTAAMYLAEQQSALLKFAIDAEMRKPFTIVVDTPLQR